MPMYSYKCPDCGRSTEIMRSMSESDSAVKCWRCPAFMDRDFQADLPHAAKDRYDKPIISDSLAISMDQIPEHRQQFPDVEVTSEGQLVFDNYGKHEAYLKKTGHVKHPGKSRKKTRKVATATITE